MIKGFQLRDAIISGSNNIINHKKLVDDLNIFPVPDGDTGTNMSMTISAAAKELSKLNDDCTVEEVSKIAASSMLRGARGNSGVILSLLFRGFRDGLAGLIEADGQALSRALNIGVEKAYGAVMKPTEGTMLTVSRVAAELSTASLQIDNDPLYVWDSICIGANDALAQTPELLPVLKKAGVVDAGGKGVCLIFEGMYSVFKNGVIIKPETLAIDADAQNSFENAISEYDEVINFTYCTEFIIGIENTKDPFELRAYLETIGDCVVVVDDEDIIKVHVHTEDPGKALQKALTFGSLLTVKIENMREQNKNLTGSVTKKDLAPCEPTEDIGFVAVAAGDGLIELFKELGCSHVVSGGQTMNPSTDDIVKAVMATGAKTVYVLPNNKNIIMAAQQATPIVKDRNVVVIPTKTIPEGLSAMLAFDPDSDTHYNGETMLSASSNVSTGLVTFAARDSEYGGHKISEGEILGLCNGKMDFVEKNPVTACLKVVKSLVNKHSSFITIIYGSDISEEDAQKAYTQISNKYSNHMEVTLVKGDQPVYYFILSVE
ncbi:MAG: DAK2 domain-containing protein [Clostridia bacterium]